jgi:DNA-binding transcriptional LysR family regulator
MRRSNGSIAPWPFVDGNKSVEAIVSGPLIAHDYPTLLGAAIRGVGLAQAPGPLAKAPIAEGRLQALLTPFAITAPGVFLYYPGKRQVLPKLRAFIEHLRYQGAQTPRERTIARKARNLRDANSP